MSTASTSPGDYEPRPGADPRLAPLEPEDWDDRQRDALERVLRTPTRNIYTTVVRAPDIGEAMWAFGRQLRSDGLPARHREILILRTGWNCRSNYEFAQHRRMAYESGMDAADVERIIAGPRADGWDPFERTLCELADELHDTNFVSDERWQALATTYTEAQLVQAVLLVGYYHCVSFALNAFRVPLEPGAVGFVD